MSFSIINFLRIKFKTLHTFQSYHVFAAQNRNCLGLDRAKSWAEANAVAREVLGSFWDIANSVLKEDRDAPVLAEYCTCKPRVMTLKTLIL